MERERAFVCVSECEGVTSSLIYSQREKYDVDRNGKIDFEEFCVLYQEYVLPYLLKSVK